MSAVILCKFDLSLLMPTIYLLPCIRYLMPSIETDHYIYLVLHLLVPILESIHPICLQWRPTKYAKLCTRAAVPHECSSTCSVVNHGRNFKIISGRALADLVRVTKSPRPGFPIPINRNVMMATTVDLCNRRQPIQLCGNGNKSWFSSEICHRRCRNVIFCEAELMSI